MASGASSGPRSWPAPLHSAKAFFPADRDAELVALKPVSLRKCNNAARRKLRLGRFALGPIRAGLDVDLERNRERASAAHLEDGEFLEIGQFFRRRFENELVVNLQEHLGGAP